MDKPMYSCMLCECTFDEPVEHPLSHRLVCPNCGSPTYVHRTTLERLLDERYRNGGNSPD